MIFNDYDFSPYLRCNPTRSVLPPINVKATEVSNKDGDIFETATLGSMTIEVSARLCYRGNEQPMEVRRKLAAMLYSTTPAKLVLDDDPTRYYAAILGGESQLDNLWRTGKADLTFICNDPIAYGASVSIDIRGVLDLSVGGTYKSYPTITAVPAANTSYWRITETTSGDYIQINHAFNGTQTVVIDCENQSATLDGASAGIDVVLASNFFALAPGHTSLKTSSGAATVAYIERWL
ncbi:MAG: phage tail family protein [Gordonibacter sp.]|uniref:distal tail protein Dit n=1 Tax=Gordonibacter sp. TaxID=1968902 RepID=UPI002FC848F6